MLCVTAPPLRTLEQVVAGIMKHQEIHYAPDGRGAMHCRRCQSPAPPVTITLRVIPRDRPHADGQFVKKSVSQCPYCEASSAPPDVINCYG